MSKPCATKDCHQYNESFGNNCEDYHRAEIIALDQCRNYTWEKTKSGWELFRRLYKDCRFIIYLEKYYNVGSEYSAVNLLQNESEKVAINIMQEIEKELAK